MRDYYRDIIISHFLFFLDYNSFLLIGYLSNRVDEKV